MKKYNQKGFALLETLLILVVVAVIGGIGWYAFNSKQKTDKILSQADKISQSTPVKTPGSQTSNSSQNYIIIKEWGLKLTTSYAKSLSHDSPTCGNPLCGVGIFFNDSVTSEKNCSLVTIIDQQHQQPEMNFPKKKIGNYSYGFDYGNASANSDYSKCPEAVNELRKQIHDSFTLDSLTAI